MTPHDRVPTLFTPFRLREVTLPNRIVVAPMCQYGAEDGCATDWHVMHLGTLAVSGFGMVIMEATAVSARGRITPACLGLYSDAAEAALARVVAFHKRHSEAALCIQLAHSGRKGSRTVPWRDGRALTADEGAWPTLAPSAIAERASLPAPLAMTASDLDRVRDEFARAAVRADRIGIDAIELHAAHGYLLHQFLSPLSNRRDDAYGGSTDARMRFPLSVFEAVRAAWPAHKPIGVRFSASDIVDDGWHIEEAARFAAALEQRGCDFLDVSSGGIPVTPKETAPHHQLPRIAKLRAASGLPMMAVGLIDDARVANRIVAERQAELVGIARAALDDPRWPWHAARTLGAQASYPPAYTRCAPGAWSKMMPDEDNVARINAAGA